MVTAERELRCGGGRRCLGGQNGEASVWGVSLQQINARLFLASRAG
jgi:hypothetical protein